MRSPTLRIKAAGFATHHTGFERLRVDVSDVAEATLWCRNNGFNAEVEVPANAPIARVSVRGPLADDTLDCMLLACEAWEARWPGLVIRWKTVSSAPLERHAILSRPLDTGTQDATYEFDGGLKIDIAPLVAQDAAKAIFKAINDSAKEVKDADLSEEVIEDAISHEKAADTLQLRDALRKKTSIEAALKERADTAMRRAATLLRKHASHWALLLTEEHARKAASDLLTDVRLQALRQPVDEVIEAAAERLRLPKEQCGASGDSDMSPPACSAAMSLQRDSLERQRLESELRKTREQFALARKELHTKDDIISGLRKANADMSAARAAEDARKSKKSNTTGRARTTSPDPLPTHTQSETTDGTPQQSHGASTHAQTPTPPVTDTQPLGEAAPAGTTDSTSDAGASTATRGRTTERSRAASGAGGGQLPRLRSRSARGQAETHSEEEDNRRLDTQAEQASPPRKRSSSRPPPKSSETITSTTTPSDAAGASRPAAEQ
jgi:hypothetical protein